MSANNNSNAEIDETPEHENGNEQQTTSTVLSTEITGAGE